MTVKHNTKMFFGVMAIAIALNLFLSYIGRPLTVFLSVCLGVALALILYAVFPEKK